MQWTILIVEGADLSATTARSQPLLNRPWSVARLGVPGALVEIAAIAAVLQH